MKMEGTLLQQSVQVGESQKNRSFGIKMIEKVSFVLFVLFFFALAPIAFKSHGIAIGKNITSYPSMRERLTESYNYCADRVVVDGGALRFYSINFYSFR